MERYPQLVFNLTKLRENVKNFNKLANEQGINIMGVIKGCNALEKVCKAYYDGGCTTLGSSRIEQLKILKEAGIGDELVLIRIPMISEIEDVIKYADTSLNSSHEVLVALNDEAKKQGKKHKVVLMIEVGDLREGYWDREELIGDALMVENDMESLHLSGLAMNVGCYGSVVPTPEKIQEFVDAVELVEEAIGRRVDVVSGGDTTSFARVLDHNMPERINEIRLGGEPMAGYTLKHVFNYDIPWEHSDVCRMRAEIVELKEKPSYPIGELAVDAFGHKPFYKDRGIRKRAILAIGRMDYGDPNDIPYEDYTLEILGASSDHTIVDVEAHEKELKVGDIIEYPVRYNQILYMTSSPNVVIKYEDDYNEKQ